MARAPNFSGNLNVDYAFALGASELQLAGNLTYTDSYVISNPSLFGTRAGPDLAGKQRYRQDAYALVNGSITWVDASRHVSVAVFARNLFDKKYRATYNGSSAFGDYSGMAPPRSIGVRLGYTY